MRDRAVRVEEVKIKGLYGLYDHSIRLNERDRVTILHGANGVGKSVLLKLIAAFFNGRYEAFAFVPFTSFQIKLSNDIVVSVSTRKASGADLEPIEVRIDGGLQPLIYGVPIHFSYDRAAQQLERESSNIARAGESSYYDYRAMERISSEELVRRYGWTRDLETFATTGETEPDAAKAVRASVTVQLVETQRLLKAPREAGPRRDRGQMVATVKSYSDEIVERISRTLARYGAESTKLDQTFPERLIRSRFRSVSADELKLRLTRLDERHTALNSLGLVEKVSYPATASEIDALDRSKLSVMALVVEDAEQKLDHLNDLASRMQLLLASVNGKLRNKALTIRRDRGLVVLDSKGQHVPLEALSSGEQHELVLWFDLLFNTGANTLVLIDEPELSLHVTWQKKFLPELLEIAKTVPFDSLIATHSPFIIGDRLDLTVPLDSDIDE